MPGKNIIAALSLVFVFILSGCDRENPEELRTESGDAVAARQIERSLALLKERVEQLEVAQAKLVEQIEAMPTQPFVIGTDAESTEVAQIEEIIATQVSQSIAAVGEQRLAEIAQQEIKSYEQEKLAAAEREREERRQEREARRQEREVQQVSEMAEQLGLGQQQSEELLIARAGLRTTIREVFDFMREQGSFDRDTMRTTMGELQAEHRKILESFMTPDQVEQYMERYNFQPGMGARGDGRGGR